MMRLTVRLRDATVVSLPVLVVLLVLAAPADAQRVRPGSRPEPGPGWTPINVGVRLGWDGRANGSLLGGQLRLPVLPGGKVELLSGGDVTFVGGTKDYQLNVEAVFQPTGGRGGLYFGGGVGWREGLFTVAAGRQRVATKNVVLGLRSPGAIGILGAQLEFRWIFPSDIQFDPQPFSIGLNLPLWGWDEISSRRP